MSPAAIALVITGAILLGTVSFALYSVRRIKMDPQQYIVGGRSFGALFLWILLAGEVYTSFTFLGAAGWAYGKGAPAFYILAYGTIGYIIGYFYLPEVWRIGKEKHLLTAPDFFQARYGSKTLTMGVAILQFLLIIPYVTLQLTGVQIVLTIAGYGHYNATVAVAAAFALIVIFTFTAGLHGAAWASVVKDSLVLGAVIFAGIVLPLHFFGSFGTMFDRVLGASPHWLTLAPGTAPMGMNWYISTVLLTSIGFYMGPHSIAAVYSARDGNTIRRNAIFLPLYQLVLLLVFLAGFTALVVSPGLKGPAVDQSFLLVVQRYYPAWVLGVIAGAGCLAALLPASAQLLGASSVFAQNVIGQVRWTRAFVVVIAIGAFIMWLFWNKTLVDLLLLYYNGVTQFMPAFIFGIYWKRMNAMAIGAGIVSGEAVAFYLWHHSLNIWGVNPGFLALIVNVAVCVAVALVQKQRQEIASSPAR
ncbi:MAG TPA: sodium:solute symporter family protein [Candidatus Baltobacteraceae bacterium]|nr:sodium:solute symporter family protein [Candidatus Baltobacteraceae bacterium]